MAHRPLLYLLPLLVASSHPLSAAAAPATLATPALQRLQTGATKPKGWLLDELTLQARGLSGQLPSFWSYFNASRWVNVSSTHAAAPQQFIPYYLNGLVPLSYQVDDPGIVALRERYVEYILAQQQQEKDADAWLGPEISKGDPRDYWSKYLAVEAFQSFAEAEPSRAKGVVASLLSHHRRFHTQLTTKAPGLNMSRWGFARYSDGLVGIQWLIDYVTAHPHPSDEDADADADALAMLWDLMTILRTESDGIMHVQDHSWEEWFTSADGDPFKGPDNTHPAGDVTGAKHLLRHGVDIGEAMKTGPLWWRVSRDEADASNAEAALEWVEKYLHMSEGMYFADEEVGGDHTPSRGTETCSVVETMFSMRTAYEITGNITFMDRLERIAFNGLPAALWDDVTANVYHHAGNQIEASSGQFMYSLFFCCSANVHQGWPKFMLSAVHLDTSAQHNGTVVVSGFAPSTTTLPDGTVLDVEGTYPFSDDVDIRFDKPLTSLRLRVPCFTDGATITTASGGSTDAPPCGFATVRLDGTTDTSVHVSFKNKIRTHVWQKSPGVDGQSQIQGGGVEVHRGPLLFALRPASDVVTKVIDSSAPSIKSRAVTIKQNTTWNYALDVASLQFVPDASGKGPPATMPFSSTAPPAVHIVAKARVVDAWTAGPGARGIKPLPASPLRSDAPEETIQLVPFGATNIRVSVFPQLMAKRKEEEKH